MAKHDDLKQKWINDTQMFQRIAGVNQSTTEELSKDWDTFNPKRKKFFSENIATHRIIQDAAIRAGKARNS